MEYTEAIAVRKRQIAGQPVDREQVQLADSVIAATRSLASEYGIEMPRDTTPAVQHRIADKPAPTQPSKPVPARSLFDSVASPMSAMCVCGTRYGMHRVGDLACMNQNWRPGNGEAQWLTKTWMRA